MTDLDTTTNEVEDHALASLVVKETPASLYQKVEDLVWKYDISYWDALNRYVTENDLEIEGIKSLIDSRLQSILEKELRSANLLKKKKRDTKALDV